MQALIHFRGSIVGPRRYANSQRSAASHRGEAAGLASLANVASATSAIGPKSRRHTLRPVSTSACRTKVRIPDFKVSCGKWRIWEGQRFDGRIATSARPWRPGEGGDESLGVARSPKERRRFGSVVRIRRQRRSSAHKQAEIAQMKIRMLKLVHISFRCNSRWIA